MNQSLTSRRQLRIAVYACARGHASLEPARSCEHCDLPTSVVFRRNAARLLANTVVRVNPSGQPFQLGVCELVGGLRSLCRIVGDVRGDGTDWVALASNQDGVFVATPLRRQRGDAPDR